jgi:hypothetical protein
MSSPLDYENRPHPSKESARGPKLIFAVNFAAMALAIAWIDIGWSIHDGTARGAWYTSALSAIGLRIPMPVLHTTMTWAVFLTPAPGFVALAWFAAFHSLGRRSFLRYLVTTALSFIPPFLYGMVLAIRSFDR